MSRMAVVTLNRDNFESTVTGNGIVLVDCRAAWCEACKTFEPVFDRVARLHSGHTFGKLDTEEEKEIVSDLGVEHIPTLLLFRDGILLFKQPGYLEEEKLEDVVRQAEALDMDEVRADMAAEQQGD